VSAALTAGLYHILQPTAAAAQLIQYWSGHVRLYTQPHAAAWALSLPSTLLHIHTAHLQLNRLCPAASTQYCCAVPMQQMCHTTLLQFSSKRCSAAKSAQRLALTVAQRRQLRTHSNPLSPTVAQRPHQSTVPATVCTPAASSSCTHP
jgi:hypothetical protein